MKGLEIAQAYYETYGKPMLEEKFPEILPLIAAGLAGSGSECFGYDDEVSRDHDFEPGFCIFLPSEDIVDRRTAFLLERAYAKLPKEFMGLKRSLVNPAGGSRHGVIRTADFFRAKTGRADADLSMQEWLTVPEASLAEAVNGRIFYDGYGEVSRIRQELSYYPDDIAKKKLAGSLLMAAQAGQYNYERCLKHGETAAAQLAVYQFSENMMNVLFILNRRYRPFYKWSFRALRSLDKLSCSAELLEYLLTSDNDANAPEKVRVIEGLCADVIDELTVSGLTDAVCGDLEKHAYSVNDRITDANLRNMHILAAV